MKSLILSGNWAIGPMSCPITGCPSRGRYCCSMNGISCVKVCGTDHELNMIKYYEIFEEGVKDYELKSQDLVEILYSDAGIAKAVLSVWELLLEWWLG